jgi:hypothetical protein
MPQLEHHKKCQSELQIFYLFVQIKLVLDMSNEGPMFKMLESMLRGGGGPNGEKVGLINNI